MAVNKGKKKVNEQKAQGKEGVLTEKGSQSKNDKASGTEVERFWVIKKNGALGLKNVGNRDEGSATDVENRQKEER